MRALVAIALLASTSAHAETVLVMADADFDSALRVAMAGRGIAVTGSDAPSGALRLERAAAAQRAAVQSGADAAVWIDERDVCAVTADGQAFRQAPFPTEAASPRTFAAIATSLLDEMIRPEAWTEGFDVNVNVSVTPRADGQRVAIVNGPDFVDALPVVAPARRTQSSGAMFEGGMMVSPLTTGVQLGFTFRLEKDWRLGGTAAVNVSWGGEYVLGVGTFELRHVGFGRKHWDVGPEIGYITDGHDPAVFAGARIARTWELGDSALSLAFSPMIVQLLDGQATLPGIYSSLRYLAPL